MVKKVSFVVATVAVLVVGLIGCASKSDKKEESNRIELKGLGELIYPVEIEVRNDIPFSMLIEESTKNLLPDTINYEKLRPDYVFLKNGFNEKDPQQLLSFPSITVDVMTRPDGSSYALGNETTERILQSIIANLKQTDYSIQEWKNIDTDVTLHSGEPGLAIAYKKVNMKTNKELNIETLYLLKKGKLVSISMSSPDSTYQEWNDYYTYIVDNIDLHL